MKIIVAHPGKQHSFRVATALKKYGMLYKYATTVYYKKGSILMKILNYFLRGDELNRARKRQCSCLADGDVIQFCEFEGLLLLALIRVDKTQKLANAFNNHISKRFQKRLAKYIIRHKVDAVISYDTNSFVLFSMLKKDAPDVLRIMDNAHPNRHFLYSSYMENANCCGPFMSTLEACGYLTNEKIAKYYGDEVRLATHHIVASSYSQKSLEFEGIDPHTIYRIPYGVDNNKFLNSTRVYDYGKLNVLFLGQVNQRKGIRQVLDAAKQINNSDIVFNIVGSGYQHHSELYKPYKRFVTFWGYVSFEELLSQLKNNHIFVFPTMGEGFGLVLLEAMAAGLVPITTENCAGRDIIEDGVNGFIIPVGDEKALVERIMWCVENPKQLKEMSKRSVEIARKYDWDAYENNVVKAVCEVLNLDNERLSELN